jgi:hypothetical protein
MPDAGRRKEEVITFKVAADLAEALAGMRNRSDFIRRAVLAALGNTCPVCSGTGALTVSQMRHWEEFTARHHMESCEDCHETHLVCDHEMVTR